MVQSFLSISKISNLLIDTQTEQASLCLTWSKKTGRNIVSRRDSSDWPQSPDSEELLLNPRVFNKMEFPLLRLKGHILNQLNLRTSEVLPSILNRFLS